LEGGIKDEIENGGEFLEYTRSDGDKGPGEEDLCLNLMGVSF